MGRWGECKRLFKILYPALAGWERFWPAKAGYKISNLKKYGWKMGK